MSYSLEIERLVKYKHKLEDEIERLRHAKRDDLAYSLEIEGPVLMSELESYRDGRDQGRRDMEQVIERLRGALNQIRGVCTDYESAPTKFINGIAERALKGGNSNSPR